MNPSLLFDILFAVIITVPLTVSPAFSVKDKKLATEFLLHDIESAVLNDIVEANDKKTLEFTVILDGNLVESLKP